MTASTTTARRLLAVATVLGPATVAWALVRTGSDLLAAPPVSSADAIADWFDERGAAVASIALLRLTAIGLSAWLSAAALLALLADLHPSGPVRRLATWVTPEVLRRALVLALGASTAVGSLGPAPAAASHGGDDPPPAVEDPPASGSVVILRSLPDAAPDAAPDTTPDAAPDTDPPAATSLAPGPDADAAPDTAAEANDRWLVEPGDSCWKVAAEVLADAWGREPTDAEVVPYWRRVVDANHERFRTGDPDLVYPGQELALPPPPTAATGG